MNRKIGKWILGATLGSAVIVSALSWAQGPGGGRGHHDPAQMMAHMASKLDLSEEQQAQVKQVMAESREASAGDIKRMRELRGQLQAQAKDFNAGTSQKLADEVGELAGRMAFMATKTYAEIYQLLSAEQRQEMDEMMAKREARRGKLRQAGKDSQDSE